MRWLLIDEVVNIQKGKAARSKGRIPSGEFSAESLMTEMMAQTGALLLGAENNFTDDVVFAKIERADFFGDYAAGNKISIEATSENLRPEGAWLDTSIKNESGLPIATSRILLTSVERLVPSPNKSTTFHEAFMNYFQIKDKVSA